MGTAGMAELVPLELCWERDPRSCWQRWGVTGADGGTDGGGSGGTARALFVLFSRSGCPSAPLPGLERDRGALQTPQAPRVRGEAAALGGRTGGGWCPLRQAACTFSSQD